MNHAIESDNKSRSKSRGSANPASHDRRVMRL